MLDLESGSMLEYTQKFNLPDKVRQLSDSIVLSSNIVIITPAAEQQLRALAASPLNTIDLTMYTAVVSSNYFVFLEKSGLKHSKNITKTFFYFL